jgi:hypothetical protein
MGEQAITIREFEERLNVFCGGGGGSGLPRRPRDRHILCLSIVQVLNLGSSYSEPQLNAALMEWLADVGRAIEIDHVTLRRYLVDAGYLRRAATGAVYEVCVPSSEEVEFEPGVLDIDPVAVVQAAREQRAARKLERPGQE